MSKITLETKSAPNILITAVNGELSVRGWDRDQVMAKNGDDEEIILVEENDLIRLESPVACQLYVPHGASIQAKSISGDALFKNLEGRLSIDNVGGSLVIRDISSTEIDQVAGELSARRIRGDLRVQRVGSSAIVKDLDGQFASEGIGGQLYLRDVSGGISVSIGGNANLRLAPVPWQAYSIKAGGNLRCQVPADFTGEVTFSSGSQNIQIRLPDRKELVKSVDHTLVLGEDGVKMLLSAGGSVELRSYSSDQVAFQDIDVDFGKELGDLADEIASDISSQIETQMNMLESHLDLQLNQIGKTVRSAGLSAERAEQIRLKIESAKERAASKAQSAAKRAQLKLEKKLASAQRKAERKSKAAAVRTARRERKKHSSESSWTVRSSPSFTPSQPKVDDPVTADERLMILKMLQDKKISAEDAEKLLVALEGK
jgi:hypothetical protein